MISTSSFEAGRPAPSPPTSTPRKRRRRAPATGATDDCFTCSTRSLTCDRRRPYCSQCLDNGKDCSGYKTTLTWGVGVASRGKLRGLSLPIVGTQATVSAAPSQPARKKTSVQVQKPTEDLAFASPFERPRASPRVSKISPTLKKKEAGVNFVSASTICPSTAPSNASWQVHFTSVQAPCNPAISIPRNPQSLRAPQELQSTALHTSSYYEQTPAPTPPGSNSGPSETDFDSPLMYTPSSEDTFYSKAPGLSSRGRNFGFQVPIPYEDQTMSSWSGGSLASSLNSMPSGPDSIDVSIADLFPHHHGRRLFGGQRPTEDNMQEEEVVEGTAIGNFGEVTDASCPDMDAFSLSVNRYAQQYEMSLSPFSVASTVGKTPRMRYLINYYAEVISPVIVAFDSPTNPYRIHILRLASESETLQHAISALSASNLRQRMETGALSTGKTDPARRSSMAHLTLTDQSWQSDVGLLTIQDQMREEGFHKRFSIRSLNAQLADPSLRNDDSILATLLILCLFHICDSGVAKFQTQFAGVKKLLGLRASKPNKSTRDTKWLTRMFTWLDAMTATVNDREGQLQGPYLDVSTLSDEEWALENLAGCDGQLFKSIAKLGRLNVLSQNQPVQSMPTVISRPLPMMPVSVPHRCDKFDGNGWSRILADEDLFSAKQLYDQSNTQFWREWREIRHDLQSWRLDTSIFDSVSSETSLLTMDQRADLLNISESFRNSALLYTERLASPSAASSDPNIQAWVQQALHYIKLVKSDVYLLWPLFITGSECVTDADRSIIRERCLDIQKDSGFLNNYSCQQLLEKVWMENPPLPANYMHGQPTHAAGMGGSLGVMANSVTGFKFRDVMKREQNEGEYIVV